MKKDGKQRLFEVMGRLDKTFKPDLNEIFGFSEKEKGFALLKKDVERAKQEVARFPFVRMTGQLGTSSTPEDAKKLALYRYGDAANDMPTIKKLFPQLFIYRDVTSNNGDAPRSIIPSNWIFALNPRERVIDDERDRQFLYDRLGELLEDYGKKNSPIYK